MAQIGANSGAPDPALNFQIVSLQTGGSYQFNVSNTGKLDFISGTTFPYGLDVGTLAELKCATKILPGGGIIQLGESDGDPIYGTEDDGDQIYVYGDADTGYSLAGYMDYMVSDIKFKTDIKRIKSPLQKIKSTPSSPIIVLMLSEKTSTTNGSERLNEVLTPLFLA